MIKPTRIRTALAVALLAAAPMAFAAPQASGAAAGQSQASKPTSGSDSVTGTITSVDSGTDVVAVKTKDGKKLRIPLSASSISKVKKGDKIAVSLSYSARGK
ncbi:hypothetical protein [Oleiagrimonas sp. C23AA]|uniref:hypothetical protein n=1 Tax=Oleiagrimonas sp. C23AA TaxID=2719047 RepID=UPI001420A1DF|nr:hypothetical protein [Oleiagrimonas sp. C23AA]NII10005.1 hypothetical protein [Oleiagrimonas sp. C23AA]